MPPIKIKLTENGEKNGNFVQDEQFSESDLKFTDLKVSDFYNKTEVFGKLKRIKFFNVY